jgi:hypothetical protein
MSIDNAVIYVGISVTRNTSQSPFSLKPIQITSPFLRDPLFAMSNTLFLLYAVAVMSSGLTYPATGNLNNDAASLVVVNTDVILKFVGLTTTSSASL